MTCLQTHVVMRAYRRTSSHYINTYTLLFYSECSNKASLVLGANTRADMCLPALCKVPLRARPALGACCLRGPVMLVTVYKDKDKIIKKQIML